jgi:CRP-like cAMP-binding protein
MKIQRRDKNPKLAELRELPLFAGLAPKQLRDIASNLDEVTVAKGEQILAAGRSNDAVWILLEGEAEMSVGGRVHLVLKRGDIFGVPSMFTHRESTADVVARTDLRALVASHLQFNGLLADRQVELRFKAAMFDRLKDEVYLLLHPLAKARRKRAAAV